MLFHATHTHSYQTCHAHDEERKAKVTEAVESSGEIGIKIHGIYMTRPHTLDILSWKRRLWNR